MLNLFYKRDLFDTIFTSQNIIKCLQFTFIINENIKNTKMRINNNKYSIN